MEFRPEARHLDVQVLVDRLEFLAQCHKVLMAAHQSPQQSRELDDECAGCVWLRPNERGDRGERVEEEMRVDLALERFNLRRQKELLLLLQPVFDARIVPDPDRRGHG